MAWGVRASQRAAAAHGTTALTLLLRIDYGQVEAVFGWPHNQPHSVRGLEQNPSAFLWLACVLHRRPYGYAVKR